MKTFTSLVLSVAFFIFSVYSEDIAKDTEELNKEISQDCKECLATKNKCIACHFNKTKARQNLSKPCRTFSGYSNLTSLL